MSTTVHKETIHKEVIHPSPPQHTRKTESRETGPNKERSLDDQSTLQCVTSKMQSIHKRYPLATQLAAALLLICFASYAAGYFGFKHEPTMGEKVGDKLDKLKSYMPGHHEEHGYSWLPWNWKLWHHQEPTWTEQFTGKDLDANWANFQSTMQNTRKGMEENLKSSFEKFETSMKNWWESWDTTAKNFKEELAKKANKVGAQMKEKLPEALQSGHTEHVDIYDTKIPSTDTIKVHHHGYEKPEDKKEKNEGLFSKK